MARATRLVEHGDGWRPDNRNDSEDTTMNMAVRTLGTLLFGVALLGAMAATPPMAWAALDGSTPMLCAINTVMECDGTGQCERHMGMDQADFPPFLRVNVAERIITDAGNSGRKTEIKSMTRLDGRLILQGGENGRGWSATIASETGRLAAGIVADEYTFALFGACTTP